MFACLFVCLFICVGASVGDDEKGGSSVNFPTKRSKGNVAIHHDNNYVRIEITHFLDCAIFHRFL